MTSIVPISFEWTEDGVMRPIARHAHRCDQQFCVGVQYRLVVEEERSINSHRHYFAAINEAFKTLPEDIAPHYLNEDHFRKRCLIETRWCTEDVIVCDTAHDAAQFAARLAKLDEYSVIKVENAVVYWYRAKSQSVRDMPKTDFEASKHAVLDHIAGMLGVSRAALEAEGEQAAKRARGAPVDASEPEGAPQEPPEPERAPATAAAAPMAPPGAPAARPNEPARTAGEYMAYAAAWIAIVPTVEDARTRWREEGSLRDALKVPHAAIGRLVGMVKTRFPVREKRA